MKTTYKIEDLMNAFNRSRSSIERYRKKNKLPPPDLITDYPQWSAAVIEPYLPKPTNNPSA